MHGDSLPMLAPTGASNRKPLPLGMGYITLRKESGPRDTSTPTQDVEFRAGDAYCQAIFHEFGITEDDESDGVRTGGFGSTGA